MNTPKIRFKGFKDDWEQRKLGEFVLRESLARESTIDLPYVEYEDVIAEEGRINKDIRKKEGIKKGIFFDGSQVLYGKLRPYLHNWLNPDFSGVAVGDWWVLKPNLFKLSNLMILQINQQVQKCQELIGIWYLIQSLQSRHHKLNKQRSEGIFLLLITSSPFISVSVTKQKN